MSEFEAIREALTAHETRSQARHDSIIHHLKDHTMSTTDHVKIDNIFKPDALAGMLGHGADGLGGLGAGLGGLLIGALLGNRGGLFGGNSNCGADGVVTPALLAASLNQVQESAQNNTVLQTLGDIKASVPLAESQVQLALAGTQTALGGQIVAVKDSLQNLSLFLSNQMNTINQNVSDQGCKTRETVQAGTTAVLTALKDGQIATLAAELAEARSTGRARETEVNVTQTVNQNQLQAQAQSQQQAQLVLLSQIAAGLGNLTQIAHATNSNIIAGNTGVVSTGTQTANPVNVAA